MIKLTRAFCFSIVLLLGVVYNACATEIWVSINGNDTHEGTKVAPLATLNMALRKARELRRLKDSGIANGIRIILLEGTYFLNTPIFIRPEDSGTATSPTIIEAYKDSKPIISGGMRVPNWKKAGSVNGLKSGTVWVADAPKQAGTLLNYRQLWVNGVKATRAKSTTGSKMNRILSWDKASETCWIPLENKSLAYEAGMEMCIQQWWAIANLRISDIEVKGDSAKLSFLQPESKIQSEHPWPAPWISKTTGNSPFYLNNALAFLDEPGEWYLDKANAKLYYYPRKGEQLNNLEVVVPVLENLVTVKGTIDNLVEHVHFKGISFQHSNWLRPSEQGHVPLQAGMYLLDAYKLKVPGTPDKAGLENQGWIGRPRAAMEINYAHNLLVEGCEFTHLSSTGLDLHRGTKHNVVSGNLFKDIGGSGINVGVFSDEAFETHLPYNPKDSREICEYERITDNLITDVTNEDWGTVGISAGFVKDITIAHNEISEVSYTGIGLGWGWTKTVNVMQNNTVKGNYIHHYGKHLYDVAAIYTLSAQPKSVITENVVEDIYYNPYAHDPYHWFYLYTDEGSSYFTVENNWVPSEKFLQNANGPDNVWQNNNAYVADSIKANAGIRKPYQHLKTEVVTDREWPLQEVLHYAALELIGTDFSASEIQSIATKHGVIAPQLYQWNNHLVLYGKLNHIDLLQQRLEVEYPTAKIKAYDVPVYNFNKYERCKDTNLAPQWKHVLLTANLVDNAQLQNEYLEYHNIQFKDWPEVAQGFCNANFQQLQVFKNNRQLLLVISIPETSTLEELNPKTTENNPKVEEWNALMKKYQTGIEGAKPGETWVFLKPLQTSNE
ncbi:L-rhamnose mutarotase [Formosa sp. A9]|uniref:L-rhamnose mutarotase n=1 Tax=Formosa sp. A9 TaxID=3442641 RepID=UPI003EB920B1